MRRAFIVTALLIAIVSPAFANGVADMHAGDQAAQKQDWGGAVRLYTRALDDRTLLSSDRANVYDKRGTAYYRNTDYAHAVADYSVAIKLSPDCGHCFNNRGMAWQDKGDLAKANDDLNTADQLAH